MTSSWLEEALVTRKKLRHTTDGDSTLKRLGTAANIADVCERGLRLNEFLNHLYIHIAPSLLRVEGYIHRKKAVSQLPFCWVLMDSVLLHIRICTVHFGQTLSPFIVHVHSKRLT